ncbi:MAG: putative metal-binding motif-containing protein [Deltaproteobacteria bacterium]|nr:putative metal-binding motif-containing protein [Deltaproteobacteria bacterium]
MLPVTVALLLLCASPMAGCISVERRAPSDITADSSEVAGDADVADGTGEVDATPDTTPPDAVSDGDTPGPDGDAAADEGTELPPDDVLVDADAVDAADVELLDTDEDITPDADSVDADVTCDPFDLKACNDDNPCTRDQCDSALGCLHVADDTLACDDGVLCTVGDRCVAGACQGGAPPDCDDGDACTVDSCEMTTGQCVHAPTATGPCDFDDPCVESASCQEGACVEVPKQCPDVDDCNVGVCVGEGNCDVEALTGVPCDDGDPCTEDDMCNAGACGGLPSSCSDGDPCTRDVCDSVTGACSNEEPDDGASCDDGDPCTEGDVCADFICAGVEACDCVNSGDCDDGNPCTSETCVAGFCEYQNLTGSCDDGNACTGADTCVAGKCKGGPPVNCDDAEPCTVDMCDAAVGCQHAPKTGSCDDGDACTVGDQCTAGVGGSIATCVPGAARDCDDGDACTEDSCVPKSGCVHKASMDMCKDASESACMTSVCQPTKGSAKTCAALGWPVGQGSPDVCAASEVPACSGLKTRQQAKAFCEAGGARLCTWTELSNDEAFQSGCSYDTERVWSSTACGTNSSLTQGGATTGLGSVPRQCTPDAALAFVRCCADVSPKTELPQCTEVNLQGECDDGNPCTDKDRCDGGQCKGDARDCSGLNSVCSTGACVDGSCVKSIAVGMSCSTGDMCIVGAACDSSGSCVGSYDGTKTGCACKAQLCGGVGAACTAGDLSEGCKTYFKDADSDGHGLKSAAACACAPAGQYTSEMDDDCNDGEGAAWTNAAERCDLVDNDCDGDTDEGYTVLGKACDGNDADMCAKGTWQCASGGTNPVCVEAGPTIVESCNGADDDCDGKTDEGFATADGGTVGTTCDGPDADLCLDDLVVCESGFAVCSTGPSNPEECNGLDDDCNGVKDDDGAAGCSSHYLDGDNDGYGDENALPRCLCGDTGKYTATTGGDCDDTFGLAHPGQLGFFDLPRPTPGTTYPPYDYNCDKQETLKYPNLGDDGLFSCKVGWLDEVPGCGKKGVFVKACFIGVSVNKENDRVQPCN